MDSKKIGTFIAVLRKEKCMTQRELADQLNITDKAISKWETGEGFPEITIIPALAEILGVSVDELFKGERQEAVNIQARTTAQADYLLNAALLKFNNTYMVSIALTALGLLAFFTITLVTYYEIIGFGVQLATMLGSGLAFGIAYNQLNNGVATYGQMKPGSEQCHAMAAGNKALMSSIRYWILSVSATLPYIVFDNSTFTRSIITFGMYLIYLPFFLGLGVLISRLVIARLGFSKHSNPWAGSISFRLGLFSDLYMLAFGSLNILVFYSPGFTIIGLAVYGVLTVWLLKRQGRQLGAGLTALLVIRNLMIGVAFLNALGSNVIWYSSNGSGWERVIYWDSLRLPLLFVLLIGISTLWGIMLLAEKKRRKTTA